MGTTRSRHVADVVPNAKGHFVAGLAVGGIVNGLAQTAKKAEPGHRFDWVEFALSSLAGGLTALLPDLLEPAATPHHRRFFHSLAASAMVAYGISGAHLKSLSPALRRLLWGIGAGFASHVLLDSTTPKSIPLIGIACL